jgi:hypothetical protein
MTVILQAQAAFALQENPYIHDAYVMAFTRAQKPSAECCHGVEEGFGKEIARKRRSIRLLATGRSLDSALAVLPIRSTNNEPLAKSWLCCKGRFEPAAKIIGARTGPIDRPGLSVGDAVG